MSVNRSSGQVNGLPGYTWFYTPAHGFLGRHAYNETTGVALSYRQVNNIRSGKINETQAISALSVPYKRSTSKNRRGDLYRVSYFRTLYGAWKYASTSNPNTPSYITAYGKPRRYYPKEASYTFRTLLTMSFPSGHASKGVFAYYHQLEHLFEAHNVGNPRSRTEGPFYVTERTHSAGSYQG